MTRCKMFCVNSFDSISFLSRLPTNRHLVVTAERKVEQVDEHGALEHQRRYERKFSLSAEVDADFLSSRYRDGKITIEAPRKKLEMRKLEIKEEKD